MVKRHSKGSDGKYHIDGKKFDQLVGSRAQVFHGTAYKTTSSAVKPKGDALSRKHLKQNKHGRIVSVAKSAKGPMMLKRLHNKGYFTRKGHFGSVKKTAKGRKSRRSHKGKKRRTKRGRRRTGVKRVTIHEKRSRRTGRFSRGGK
ncbi:MAG: hypothetical protein H8E55_12490 [Pelagibacterales bacterium]|nr:hypothetical protein [Pelagibacterales bacterium]